MRGNRTPDLPETDWDRARAAYVAQLRKEVDAGDAAALVELEAAEAWMVELARLFAALAGILREGEAGHSGGGMTR